jgi:hypothetical protein
MMWIASLIMLFSVDRKLYWTGVQKGSNLLAFQHQDVMAHQKFMHNNSSGWLSVYFVFKF